MDAIVVGGGLAGLVVALRLKERGRGVVVLEAERRAGGRIWTEREGGLALEGGPQTCFATPGLRALAGAVGLAPATLPKSAKWLVEDGRLVAPWRAFSARGLLRALGGALFTTRAPAGADAATDETVAAYARRRFGEEALRRLFDPMVGGIFAGDPEELSYASALGGLRARRGLATVTFEGGMGALPEALAARLGGALRLGVAATRVARAGPRFAVSTSAGETLEAPALVVATPAFAASGLLADVESMLAHLLAQIPYRDVTAVSLAYDAAAFAGTAPRGFGFLASRDEAARSGAPDLLGCIFCPAPPGRILLRPMLRGLPADALVQARRACEAILGARGEPAHARVHPHRRGIPQYAPGHAARLVAIEERLRAVPGLHLAGNAYHGVGVPDVIDDAERVARAAATSPSPT